MHAKPHFTASLIVGIVSLPFNQSTPFLGIKLFNYEIAVFFLCIVAGVFVDIDHIMDFRLNRELINESLESRFRQGRLFLVLHGIENIMILAGLSIPFPFLAFLTISYICHLAMDIYSNGAPYRVYFCIVRFGRKFVSVDKLCSNGISL